MPKKKAFSPTIFFTHVNTDSTQLRIFLPAKKNFFDSGHFFRTILCKYPNSANKKGQARRGIRVLPSFVCRQCVYASCSGFPFAADISNFQHLRWFYCDLYNVTRTSRNRLVPMNGVGLRYVSPIRITQCKWLPVEKPVFPIWPMVCPR